MPVSQLISRYPPADERIKALSGMVPVVREKLRGMARPLVVEFAGTPRSGKSTCISIVRHFKRRNGMTVFAPLEGASQTPEFLKKQLFEYNTWAACYALMNILEGIYIRQPEKYDFVLLDRGLFDAICWLSFVRRYKLSGDIVPLRQFKNVTRFLRLERWKSRVDFVCLITSSPSVAWRREHEAMLIKQGGLVTNRSFLTHLLEEYKKCARCYLSDFRESLWLRSASNSSAKAAACVTLHRVFDIVRKQRQ